MPTTERRKGGPAATRAWRSLQTRGPAETWAIAKREAERKLDAYRRISLGRWFDFINRIETQEPYYPPGLGVAGTAFEDSVCYGATPHWKFRALVRRLGITPSAFTFVDLGCGRGRMLFVAAQLGFPRAVGVELDPKLSTAARQNIESYRGRATDFVLHEMDALEFEFPDDPFILFLFDPFGERSMAVLARQLDATLSKSPRAAYVIYHRAWFRQHFAELSTLRTVQDDLDWAVYATA